MARLGINHPAERAVLGQTLQRKAARNRSRAQLDRHKAKWFGQLYPRQMSKIGDRPRGPRLNERQRNRLPLHDVPLKIDYVGDSVAKRIRHDQDASRQRERQTGQSAANRSPLNIPQRHAERRAEPTRCPHPLSEGWPKTRRRFGPHRFGGWQAHGSTHRTGHANKRRECTHNRRRDQHPRVENEIQLRKAEK